MFFIFIKGQLQKFQEYFTIFGFLTNAPGTLVDIFHKNQIIGPKSENGDNWGVFE
jgi:hypothetical protein